MSMEKTITVTLPSTLLDRANQLVESGMFLDLEEVIRAGLRRMLFEWAVVKVELASPESSTPATFRDYLGKLHREISAMGGLFPESTDEEVIALLRQTREQVFREKYATHFGQQ